MGLDHIRTYHYDNTSNGGDTLLSMLDNYIKITSKDKSLYVSHLGKKNRSPEIMSFRYMLCSNMKTLDELSNVQNPTSSLSTLLASVGFNSIFQFMDCDHPLPMYSMVSHPQKIDQQGQIVAGSPGLASWAVRCLEPLWMVACSDPVSCHGRVETLATRQTQL